MAPVTLIRSAGGVVWRDRSDGTGVEIAIVHRDRYDDWSLPKGKLEPGEHLLTAAVREVREETGVVALPQVRLPSVRYLTGEPDTEKTVDFWSMRALTATPFEANDEITELRWLDVAAAAPMLTYAHDRGVVTAFSALPLVTGVAVLVRHAHAGSRKNWNGPDDQRPLDVRGTDEATRLAPVLAAFKPARVCSAPLLRCIDTVTQIGLPVRTDTVFAEATAAAAAAVAERIRGLVAEHGRVVIASQGGVIPQTVAALRSPNVSATATLATPKGSAWVLSFAGTEIVAADQLTL
jgi:8-oxo-dGTP pyrophosphatase MutT (NUDIX family)/phosphohistidine phosphatase SixA